ncbi:MAG TPA: RNA polymerase sigma-54 factor, partial [Candidatus Limisoma intestinavium]|nr:RNA polymerase sigma-54 factor [Candidatus Limisoma intestinavium]
MKETLHLTQEQKLQQRLSPQQVQFVRLLEMNRVEMEDEVRHEVLDNPAIQVSDSDESGQHDDFNESGNDNEEDG